MESLHPYEVSACKCMLLMMGLGRGGGCGSRVGSRQLVRKGHTHKEM